MYYTPYLNFADPGRMLHPISALNSTAPHQECRPIATHNAADGRARADT